MKTRILLSTTICLLLPQMLSAATVDTPTAEKYVGEVLPFPPPVNKSIANATLAESTLAKKTVVSHLPKDAPNILVVLLDDVGFGLAETFGGEIHTPTLSKLAEEGIVYNHFHTTSICSPTRASLLTGRNHTRVGSGTIAERAVNWDGYTGVMPMTSATFPEVLKQYGYKTSAFGKWHNTPATETTAMGPKDRWPNGYGFEYFYGFLAGETSQYEPRLVENYNYVEPPHDEKYHLTEDMVEKGLAWIDRHQSFSPDKPFLMYWAPGAAHGPHHVFKEWSEKYKGKFDDGWDEYRKRTYERQIKMGIIPKDTKLTTRDETMPSWESIPEAERPFQRRLMEIFAGFVEHTDTQVGKLIAGLEKRGLKDNTLIIYIFGDNGSSAEGQGGSISELLAQNQIKNTIEQQLTALDEIGGLDALGTHKTDNMYHSGWAWAGSTPFKGTKLLGNYFGGTRNPMVISWPNKIKADSTPRNQFLHVNDIAPTIYDILNIKAPSEVNGQTQDPIDGKSFAATFTDAKAKAVKGIQFFDNNGARGIYHNGWFAGAKGPFKPWVSGKQDFTKWDSSTEPWELYDLSNDFSQSNDLSTKHPKKLAEMQALFLKEAKDNKAFPIGAGIWLRMHPEDMGTTGYDSWKFTSNTQRMPEFTAPGLGRVSSTVTIDLEVGEKASGVLYALGGGSGGITLYMDKGKLFYEYNMMIIERYKAETKEALSAGKHTIEITTKIVKPGAPGTVVITVDGNEVAQTALKRTVPLIFTASETFDVGMDLGSPVSPIYDERRPFAFDGTIYGVDVKLTK